MSPNMITEMGADMDLDMGAEVDAGAAALLAAPVYGGYQYSYPHKTAYRPLSPPARLRDLWAGERRGALFLYLHIPFCEMRCGFCNLFTLTRGETLVPRYMAALERQAAAVAEALGGARVARMAIGGGTPTFLAPDALDAAFGLLDRHFVARPSAVPTSVETSPKTATAERLAVLKARGVDRVSLGVESFDDAEVAAMGRPQRRRDVEAALAAIRDAGFRTLNVDLIYGAAGQTPASFLASVEAALAWAPEEIFLYPLYVRPLTGLGRRAARGLDAQDDCAQDDRAQDDRAQDGRAWDAQRLAIHRAARDRLLGAGYRQVSMRLFRRAGHADGGHADEGNADGGPAHDPLLDGMVGLGAGARSYTSGLHYSTDYAVARTGVAAILEDFVGRDAVRHGLADYGVRLGEDDRRRRFALLSLLECGGLSGPAYAAQFGAPPLHHMPELAGLVAAGLAAESSHAGGMLALTAAGLERADAIGPWLRGAGVVERMRGFAQR